jgi:phospholipid/cholesterol/gamma-HCH transport system permease protein
MTTLARQLVLRTSPALDFFREFVELAVLLIRTAIFSRWRGKEIMNEIYRIGVGSLPIIALSTSFAGLVITSEIAWHMELALHSTSMIPGFTGQFILRELGIAIPALLVVSKVGASMTAEIGSMKVTEQIDALKLLKIDPIQYLVFPRWIASIVSLVCLTVIALGITMGCATFMAITQFHFNFLEYVTSLRHFVSFADLVCAITKSIAFGATFPVLCCIYGFRCKGGAQGVGFATTQAVVASTLSVIVLDFVITFIFTQGGLLK